MTNFESARECWEGTCDCEVPTRRDTWSIWVSSVRWRLCEWFGRTEECGCMYLLGRQMFWCFPHLFPLPTTSGANKTYTFVRR